MKSRLNLVTGNHWVQIWLITCCQFINPNLSGLFEILEHEDKWQQVDVCVLHLFLFVTNPNDGEIGGKMSRKTGKSKTQIFAS